MNTKQKAELENLGDSSQYKEQGEFFLEACGVHMEAVKAIPQEAPEWAEGDRHGTQWSITFAKINHEKVVANTNAVNKYTRVEQQPHLFSEIIRFPFWGSIADKQKAMHSIGEKKPKEYDILAGLDSMYNDTFEDWCFNYGYDEDSREAYKTYKRCIELDTKLKKVFTSEEMDALSYIN